MSKTGEETQSDQKNFIIEFTATESLDTEGGNTGGFDGGHCDVFRVHDFTIPAHAVYHNNRIPTFKFSALRRS